MNKNKEHFITPKWTFKDAIIALLISALTYGAVVVLASALYFFDATAQLLKEESLSSLVITYVLTALTLIVPILYLVRKRNLTLKDFDLKETSFKKLLLAVLYGYFLLFLLGVLLTFIQNQFGDIIPGLSRQEDLPFISTDVSTKLVGGFIAVIIAPIIEEVFFRGFILKTLITRMPFIYASIITAAIFALVHFQFESLVGIFLLSMIINYLYKRGNYNITHTIAFHMVNNLVALSVLSSM